MATRKRPVVLVFGEDDNDRQSLAELIPAICPDAPPVRKRKSPLVLVKGRAAAEAAKNANLAARIVGADALRSDIRLVVAHQDCDDVEPAHVRVATDIESVWGGTVPCPVVAAAPAFEMEAWWFLFPAAVARVVAAWRPLPSTNRNVGKTANAKEALTQALRPNIKQKPRDYTESDSPEIARYVRELGLALRPQGKSGSYARFADAIRAALCP